MVSSRNPWMICLAMGALVLTLVAAPWLVPANGKAQGYACSDYLYREDAQNGFQDYEACPELPSLDTAPTCSDFATQAAAQAVFDQDPYRYWTLTDYAHGGTDMFIACPELAGVAPVVTPPVPVAPVAVPDTDDVPVSQVIAPPARRNEASTSDSLPTDASAGGGPLDVVPTDAGIADEAGGSEAIIAAGTCATDTFGDPVAELTDVVSPVGEATGADAFSTVATSFSTVDLTLDALLADEHVLVVFDEIQTERALACGSVGGVVADDGSLSIGLRETPGAGWSGVAYFSPDTSGTSVTIFLADGLAAAGETSEEE